MSVGINGISKLNANDYVGIDIKQIDSEDYIVDVYGDRIGKVNSKFCKDLKGVANEEKIVAIIDRYLDNFKINGITDLVELSYKNGKWLVVYGNDSKCTLRLQLFNKCFRSVFTRIKRKYLDDRYDCFWNIDNNLFRFGISIERSMYYKSFIQCGECNKLDECNFEDFDCYKYTKLDFKLDNDGNILDLDKIFIKEFLLYRFDLNNKEVICELNKEIDSRNSIYIIRCGDFELKFPNRSEFEFILDIVNEYNNELFKINNNIKKRQLKMEGF